MPDSVISRSIQVKLKRKLPRQHVEPLYEKAVEQEAASLRKRLARWAATNRDNLARARPQRLDGLGDRAFEVWAPLLAIADVALGEWPQRARQAALALSSPRQANVQSLGIQLLADIRTIASAGKRTRFSSKWLVGRLQRAEGSPWADYRGTELSTHKLAQMLKPYEIESRAYNTSDEGWFRGYARADFEDAFARYLPPLPLAKGK